MGDDDPPPPGVNIEAAPFVPPPNLLPLPSAVASQTAHPNPAASKPQSEGMVVLQKATRPWTQAEQLQLEVAMRTVPRTEPKRWQLIASKVEGRTAKACALRAKELADEMKAAKAAKTADSASAPPTPKQPESKQKMPEAATAVAPALAPKATPAAPKEAAKAKTLTNAAPPQAPAVQAPAEAPAAVTNTSDANFHQLIANIGESQPRTTAKPKGPKVRPCVGCGDSKDRRQFSKTQWLKPDGVARCTACIDLPKASQRSGNDPQKSNGAAVSPAREPSREAAPAPAPAAAAASTNRKGPQVKPCADCGEAKPRGDYSKSQWIKHDTAVRRCAVCVEAAVAARKANRGNAAPKGEAAKSPPLSETVDAPPFIPQSKASGGPPEAAAAAPTKPRKRERGTARVMSGPLATTLPQQLHTETYECMVCYDKVRRRQEVWNCRTCYRVFHLKCIRKWAAYANDRDDGWRCPGCQGLNSKVPSRYFCFCGRVESPSYTAGNPPHTCGDPCHNPRECGHDCTDPCHAGPCLPCPVMVPRSCFCGKRVATVRCSTEVSVTTCGEVCDRLLGCGQHRCTSVCHDGPCTPCQVVEQQECFCGLTEAERPCGSGVEDGDEGGRKFTCGGICDAELDCGNHRCTDPCHAGPCAPCALLPETVTTCPCRKTKLFTLGSRRKSCLDPVATCTLTCNKPLPCSVDGTNHRCEEFCHHGECPPCTESVEIFCDCGSSSEFVPCAEAKQRRNKPKCAKLCNRKLNCSRHRCPEVCCMFHHVQASQNAGPYEPHMCTRICGKVLRCGVHECDQLCHRGHCPPCLHTNFEDLACHCGKTVLEPPTPCGTPAPICQFMCTREHACDHEVRHVCHREERCPPCVELVSKPCWGGHAVLPNIRCHVAGISCGKQCGKTLACGAHVCPELCHPGECEGKYATVPDLVAVKRSAPKNDEWAATPEEKEAAERAASEKAAEAAAAASTADAVDSWEDLEETSDADKAAEAQPTEEATPSKAEVEAADAAPSSDGPPSCGLRCGRARACGHPCQSRCHPGRPCPDVLCKVAVQVRCDCGRRAAIGDCGTSHGRRVAGDSAAVDAAISFTKSQLGPGFTRQPPRLKPGTRLVCDAKCAQLIESAKKMARNRQIAEALGLTGADSTDLVRENYSEDLLRAALRKATLVALLERTYAEFVQDEAAKRKALPVMKSDDRQIAHELAEHYGLDSASYDPEPRRNVVIFRSDFKKARIPHPLLSKAAK